MCPVYFVTHVPGLHHINDHVAGLVVDFAEHALLLRTPITVCAPVNSLLLGRSPHLAAWRLGGLSLSLVRDAEGFDGCAVARDHQKFWRDRSWRQFPGG